MRFAQLVRRCQQLHDQWSFVRKKKLCVWETKGLQCMGELARRFTVNVGPVNVKLNFND